MLQLWERRATPCGDLYSITASIRTQPQSRGRTRERGPPKVRSELLFGALFGQPGCIVTTAMYAFQSLCNPATY